MKLAIFCVVATLAYLGEARQLDVPIPSSKNPCPEHGAGYLTKDDSDCGTYYVCLDSENTPQPVKCPKGQYFDLSTRRCLEGECKAFVATTQIFPQTKFNFEVINTNDSILTTVQTSVTSQDKLTTVPTWTTIKAVKSDKEEILITIETKVQQTEGGEKVSTVNLKTYFDDYDVPKTRIVENSSESETSAQ